ncbi:DUF3732 domain-containing protein [Vibrio sp. V08_P9A1T1]|uniref:DUF3732 domain-containing protein n=1 Tax=Vibrio sp. V08_P9A1T1 TaxID=1938663 RepID=UPI000B8EA494|nr:DUF3732 domain-containing protein [Vibrio sp. V08_P9A1T1]OXX23618.1 hypothetical protein B9J92_12365 [Vibrio sp. V08_P9A1T1]
MQIKSISVYSKYGERNDVNFSTGSLNILTGASKRGKSQLIEIIDYCLGRSECNVADGLITEVVSWYSVLLQLKDSQVFIARKAPEEGMKSSSTCDLRVSQIIELPSFDDLKHSTNTSGIEDFLSRKLGISEYLTQIPEGNTRSSISISFKHTKSFLFQAQEELASKRILFHRQSEPFIPQVIKDTLPYFIGATNEDHLKDLDKLRKLRQERSQLRKKIREIDQLKGEGLQKGRVLLSEAIAHGLAEADIQVSDVNLVSALTKVTNLDINSSDPKPFNENPLRKLEKERDDLLELKKVVRAKMDSIESYKANLGSIGDEYREQSLRLQSINLFKKLKPEQPDVENWLSEVKNAIADNATRLDKDLEGLKRTEPRLNNAIKDLCDEDDALAKKLKLVRNSIDTLLKERGKLSARRSLEQKKSWVMGRISLYLESLGSEENSEYLKKSIERLEPQIEHLERKVSPNEVKLKLESQLSCIADDMTKWARALGLEHSQHPIRLDPKDLTVVAETAKGRTPLYRMGSGANWVGYHLVTYIALAKWFIEQERPVPNFVFFDQPTQVFFPSDMKGVGSISDIEKDEDREAVVKMFKWLTEVSRELAPHLQIIVTDHADIDEDWFQECTVKPKWRGQNALIPHEWVSRYSEEI